MEKYTKLKNSDVERLSRLINESEELDEAFEGLKNIYHGVRGFVKGESYGYFRYLSKIKNRSAKVVGELSDIENFMNELKDLRPKVEKLTIAPEKKWRLLNLLDLAINTWEPFFPTYSKTIKQINNLTSEKLSGERLDVVPGLKSNQINIDLTRSKDDNTNSEESKNIEVVDSEPVITTTTTVKNSMKMGKKEMETEKAITEEISRFRQLIK